MKQRTLSLPVFALSVVALAAVASGFHFTRGWQLSRLSGTLLVHAKADEKSQQWLKAAEHLDRYLRLQPQDNAARAQLALAYSRGAKTPDEKQRAVALYYRALAAESPEHGDALREGLAELLLETGRLLEAENEAQTLLSKAPDHARAKRVFALARYFQWRGGALASKRPAELRLLETVEDALKKNPADIALAEIAAILYRDFPEVAAVYRTGLNQLGREQLADDVIDRMVKSNAGSAAALLARHIYRAKYEVPGADVDLEGALKLAPDDPQVLLVAGRAHYQKALAIVKSGSSLEDARQSLQTARRLFSRLIEKDLTPNDSEPHLRLGDVLVLDESLDAAIAVWRKGLLKFRTPTVQVAFQARIADHLLKAGRIAESKNPLEAIEAILADLGGTIRRENHLALMQAQGLRRATWYFHNGRFSEAIGEVHQAIARQPQLQPDPKISHRAWDLLGRGYAGLEDWTAAATAFDRAANFQPGTRRPPLAGADGTGGLGAESAVTSRLAAAKAWLSAGRADLAIDRAQQVVATEGLAEAWIVLASAELQVQAQTPPLERSWEGVAAALKGLEEIESEEAVEAPWRIDFLRADYIALRVPTADDQVHGRSAAAEVLRLAERKHQDRPQFWFEVCLAYERLQQTQDAERAWEQLNGLPGAQTIAAIAASRRAAMHEDYAKAHRILQAAGGNVSPAAQSRLRQELLAIAQAKQDLPEMKALLSVQLQERPNDVGVLCSLAELELRAGNYSALPGWEEKLTAAGQLGELWARYFRVVRLYSSAKDARDPALQEALSQQAQLATLRPNWPESYALRGAIEQRLERLEQAAAAYEQAIQLGERRYWVFEQLIDCLDRLHRPADVEKYLARLESYLPASQRLTEIATNHRLDSDQPDRAVEVARRAADERPGDLRARLWLGRLLLVTNRLGEAHTVFEQATKDAPQDVRSWNGLLTYYLRTGEKGRARGVLESIRQHARLDAVELEVALGQGYLRLGETSRAMRMFTDLSEQAPDRADVQLQLARLYLESDRDKAKEHLQKAVELDPKLREARWLLAAILAAGGSQAEMAEAEQLLGRGSGAGDAATIEDRRVRAMLLAQHGTEDGLDRAIQILEQLVAGGQDSSNDHLLLAQFYERQAEATPDPQQAAARLKAARDQLLALASRPRAQVADVAALANFLLRQGQTVDAGVWLDRLEERIRTQAGGDPRAIALLIELRIKHGTLEECEPWIARLESIDRDPIRPLAARVRYMAARGNTDQIEPTVEKQAASALSATENPQERTRIARAIGDLYLGVFDLVRDHPSGVAQLKILPGAERWYRIVVRDDRQQFPILAHTLMRQGRPREAIRLCETAKEHDPSSRPAVVLTKILLDAGGKAEHIKLAEAMFAAALEEFPEDEELLYGIGMLRVFEDRYGDAIGLLRRVLAINPRHVPALNNLAVLVAETPDQREEALALIDRAIELRGQQPTLLDTKGTILVFSGRSKEAVWLLEAAARGTTSDPRHKFHLAIAYHDVGTADQAREQFGTALRQDLESQILTPTDRKSLDALRKALSVSTPGGNDPDS